MRTALSRRSAVFVFGAVLLSAVLSAPVAAAEPAPCAWQVAPVPTDGWDAAGVFVTGSDGHGNYSGYARFGQDTQLLLWTQGGEPESVEPPNDFGTRTQPVDENSAGTVLLETSTPEGYARPFRYVGGHTGAGTFHALPTPEGHEQPEVSALNDRGDVVGTARRSADAHMVAVLWPAAGGAPVVIDSPEYHWTGATDIDEDGTVLLGGAYEAHLWRDGQVIPLPEPAPPVIGRALRGGKAVGIALGPEAPRAVLWNSPSDIQFLDGGGTAEDINQHGLIAGHLDTWNGPAAAWQDAQPLGRLPLPPGATAATLLRASDDNTIFGYAEPDIGPVRWTCVSA